LNLRRPETQISPFSPDLNIDNLTNAPIMKAMGNRNIHDLVMLAKVFLEYKHSFVVRRFVQRYGSGEISAQEALSRILEHLDVRDDDLFAEEESAQ